MRSRRSLFVVSVLAASALITGGIASPAFAADPPPDFTATPVEPAGPPQDGARSKSGQLAESDAALLARSDGQVVPIMVKVDVDPVASYTGDVEGYAATSPEITGKDAVALGSRRRRVPGVREGRTRRGGRRHQGRGAVGHVAEFVSGRLRRPRDDGPGARREGRALGAGCRCGAGELAAAPAGVRVGSRPPPPARRPPRPRSRSRRPPRPSTTTPAPSSERTRSGRRWVVATRRARASSSA